MDSAAGRAVFSHRSLIRLVRALMLVLLLQVGLGLASTSQAAAWMSFDEMYAGVSSQGLVMSNKLTGLNGQQVSMQGFMAPPLKPTINFFVLTQTPMSICPFCSTDADWPTNIVVVYLDEPVTALPYDAPITVTGTLDVGSFVDGDTGFVSLVRIHASSVSAS